MAGDLWLPRNNWAHSAADSAYPELWDGLFSAWVPSVGFSGAAYDLYDAGPYHLPGNKSGGSLYWDFDPKLGPTIKTSYLVGYGLGIYVPMPLHQLTVVSVFKPCSGYGGSNVTVRLAECDYSSNGWSAGWYHPSSGGFITDFSFTNSGGDSWNSAYVQVPITAGKWYVAVYRYNGKTKSVEVYGENGAVATASAACTNGGSITYYWYSKNTCRFFNSYDSTDRHAGCLIYSKDIGPGLSRVFGKGGPFARHILDPFVPRAGKVFSSAYVGTSYDVEATSALSLSDEAAITNFSRGVSANSAVDLSVTVSTNFAKSVAGTTPITLVDTAGFNVSKGVDAANTIVLTSEAALFPWTITEVAAESTLSLGTTASGRQARFWPSAESTIELTHSADILAYYIAEVSAESTLSLTSEATGRHSHFRPTAESAIELTVDSTSRHAHFRPTAESTIVLTSASTSRKARFWASAETTIVLDQTLSSILSFVVHAAAESTITLFGEATGRHSHFRPVALTTITVSDSALSRAVFSCAAESAIQRIVQEYDSDLDELVTTIVGLQDSASSSMAISSAARSVIPLIQRAGAVRVKSTAIAISAESALDLVDQSWKNEVGEAQSILHLLQSATIFRANPTGSVIELTDTAGVTVTRKRSASSVIELKQSVTYSIVRPDVLTAYQPFIGEGPVGAPTPPPATLPGF